MKPENKARTAFIRAYYRTLGSGDNYKQVFEIISAADQEINGRILFKDYNAFRSCLADHHRRGRFHRHVHHVIERPNQSMHSLTCPGCLTKIHFKQ